MSSLETKELEFARQVRRALDENAASIPSATVDRLAVARRAALARKKPETVSAPVVCLAASSPRLHRPRPPTCAPAAGATQAAKAPAPTLAVDLPSLSNNNSPMAWSHLSSAEHVALARFASQWDSFSEERKRKW